MIILNKKNNKQTNNSLNLNASLTLNTSLTLITKNNIILRMLIVVLIIYFISTMLNWNIVYFYILIVLTLGISMFSVLLYNNSTLKYNYIYTGECLGAFLGNYQCILQTIADSTFNDTFIVLNWAVFVSNIINGFLFSQEKSTNWSFLLNIWKNKKYYFFLILNNKINLLIILSSIWLIISAINAMLFMLGLGIVVDTTSTELFLYTFLAKVSSIRTTLTFIICSITKKFSMEHISVSPLNLLFMLILGWINYVHIIPYINELTFNLGYLQLKYTNFCLYITNILDSEEEITNMIGKGIYDILKKFPMVGRYLDVFLSNVKAANNVCVDSPFRNHNSSFKKATPVYHFKRISRFTPINFPLILENEVQIFIFIIQTLYIDSFRPVMCDSPNLLKELPFYNLEGDLEKECKTYNHLKTKQVRLTEFQQFRQDFSHFTPISFNNIFFSTHGPNKYINSYLYQENAIEVDKPSKEQLTHVRKKAFDNTKYEGYHKCSRIGLTNFQPILVTKEYFNLEKEILSVTEPSLYGFDLKVYMQPSSSYFDTVLNKDEPLIENFQENRGTKRAITDNEEPDTAQMSDKGKKRARTESEEADTAKRVDKGKQRAITPEFLPEKPITYEQPTGSEYDSEENFMREIERAKLNSLKEQTSTGDTQSKSTKKIRRGIHNLFGDDDCPYVINKEDFTKYDLSSTLLYDKITRFAELETNFSNRWKVNKLNFESYDVKNKFYDAMKTLNIFRDDFPANITIITLRNTLQNHYNIGVVPSTIPSRPSTSPNMITRDDILKAGDFNLRSVYGKINNHMESPNYHRKNKISALTFESKLLKSDFYKYLILKGILNNSPEKSLIITLRNRLKDILSNSE